MMANTMDEAYAERAARRSGPGPVPVQRATERRRTSLAGAAALVLLGVLTGTAVDQVRGREEATAGVRADLAEQVDQRADESAQLDRTVSELSASVAAVRDEALGADVAGQQAGERLRVLEQVVGTAAVTGPGLVVTLDDAPQEELPEPDLRGGAVDQGRVIDRDLQDLVNGLWAAGAEAVAINGVRLSSRAAVRSAGEAVLVDFTPLSPPYVLEAIGDSAALEVDLLDGPSGRRLQTLTSFSGITFSTSRERELVLPAAGPVQLRSTRLPGSS